MADPTPAIFPRPRHVEIGGDPPPPGAAPRFARDPALPPQGYALRAGRDGVEVSHADAAGRRHAEDTLVDLARAHGGALPGCVVRDWPDFPVRGVMLDVSRDRVPTRETLALLVDRLALLRMNHLELYTEHTFAYPGHEVVWQDASPLTPDDVRWLDDRCRERGIELCANQNTFGHMERWLRHPAYRERAEAPEGWEAPDGRRRRASVLAPTRENAAFALELVRELLRHFSSARVNIGCDETFELGTGKSRADVAARGRGRVYLEHLRRLLDPLHAEGREVLFWGDVLRSHPELVGELPRRDTVALVWHYEAPLEVSALPAEARALLEGYGMAPDALRGFASQAGPFADAGVPWWVCPGTSTWNSLVGRLPNARANLRDAAEVGLARGAGGFLVTDWGDNGHLQPPSVSLAPLLDAAGQAWNAALHRDLPLASLLDARIFGDAAGRLGAACEAMGEVYAHTGLVGWNASPLQAELLAGGSLRTFGTPDARATAEVVERLDGIAADLARARPDCPDGELVVRELVQAVRLARHGAWRLLRRAGGPAPDTGALRRDLAEAIAEQRACWLARSRPGGLEDSLARLQATLATYDA